MRSMSQPQQSTGAPPVPPVHSEDGLRRQGAILIGVSSMLLFLCTLAVAGRLTVRRMIKATLEADDFVAIWALVSTFVVIDDEID